MFDEGDQGEKFYFISFGEVDFGVFIIVSLLDIVDIIRSPFSLKGKRFVGLGKENISERSRW